MKCVPFLLCSLFGLNTLFAEELTHQVDALVHPKKDVPVIRVGDETSDLPGFTSSSIQNGIDLAASKGGGIVDLDAGIFKIIGPVQIKSGVTLQGQGEKTVLRKCSGLKTGFESDADYGELKITVKNPDGFMPGMGVQVFDESQDYAWHVSTAVITHVDSNIIYIDEYLKRDYHADDGGVLSNACAVISAVETQGIVIRNLTVDGNKAANDYLNGCRGGAVYIHKSTHALIEDVIVRDFNGDGISWQLTEDVTVRGCDVSGCTNTGLHPGTGSPRTIIENNRAHHNDQDGLFICWRVHHGLVKNNQFDHNKRYGLCTGHKDTDMLFTGNHIMNNGLDGVHFRKENESNAPHRNTFLKNIIENNGRYGFSFNSPASEVILRENIIRNQKTAVYIDEHGLPVQLIQNQISE